MIIVLVIAILFVILVLWFKRLGKYDHPKIFRFFIKRYSKQDKIKFPEPNSILFTGSSIVKFWKTIENDLSPFDVLNRGIAGTKINEIVYWADELVIKYQPKAVVLYAGSNDIQGSKPRTPEQVLQGFIEFSDKMHQKIHDLPVIYISITPSPARTRWRHWNEIQKVNSMIQEYCKTNHSLKFVDTTAGFLGPDGMPLKALFKKDMIHFNDTGYKIWSTTLRPVLEKL